MFLEIILAGLVATSAHYSAKRAASGVIGKIDESTMKLEKHLSMLEHKVDRLNIKIDSNQVRLMRALTWHDYVQTLHVKGAKYKGDNLYVLKEKRTLTTANLLTKMVTEVNGDFTLYKSFNDNTEKLYSSKQLIYEKTASGEISAYDAGGKLYMHTNGNNDTYIYRPDGKTQEIIWADGSIWRYRYDEQGIVSSVETANMTSTSRLPPATPAEVKAWQDCAQKNSVGACMNRCTEQRGASQWDDTKGRMRDNGCFTSCQYKRDSACGKFPKHHM